MNYSLDYTAVGRRIRECRLALGMTQEKLAEAAGIGVQHMSKIETGGTKLSLPCIVAVANALEVTVDSLLMDSINASQADVVRDAESSIFADCTQSEVHVITQTIIALKRSLREHGLPYKQ